ncbi:MAG: Flavin-dependent oxidoreductase, luciferase family [Hyphomicrobiales bacterium]|nr:Flavin-dependent oxidoreductase, luciferase family [Hyphomicrobiales bacterium]
MKFGIFDHLDNSAIPAHQFFSDRLTLIELYDRYEFHCYHIAEHHGTTLGMAPSPNVFLAAVAQRTKRLRFGPMVYALPLYHPLRLVQEICMLDQLSQGRLDVGFGRGSSPVEIAYFGVDPHETEAIFQRTLPAVLSAIESGVFIASDQQPPFQKIELKIPAFQRPGPPVWYGVHTPESAERAARRGWQTINLDTAEEARICTDAYLGACREVPPGKEPLLGLGRFIVVASSDHEAQALARRAYPHWHESFTHLARTLGSTAKHPRPATWEALEGQGKGIAGSPETVARLCADQLGTSRCNYLVGQFAFGDQNLDELTTSVRLFAEHVMPRLRGILPMSGAFGPTISSGSSGAPRQLLSD